MNKIISDLREKLNGEDNEIKAFALDCKIIREERHNKFKDNWLPKIQEKTSVNYNEISNIYTFELPSYGKIDLFPKSNKMLIRKGNKCKTKALKLIIQDLKL